MHTHICTHITKLWSLFKPGQVSEDITIRASCSAAVHKLPEMEYKSQQEVSNHSHYLSEVLAVLQN